MGSTFIGSGGSPGGSDTQVQFNNSGAFGGDAGLTYNKTTDTLSVGLLLSGHDTNLLIGSNAGASITGCPACGPNTFVGNVAGAAVTSGAHDVLIGASAAAALLSGKWNIIIGDGAVPSLTTGNDN